jgi:hypothetical protein
VGFSGPFHLFYIQFATIPSVTPSPALTAPGTATAETLWELISDAAWLAIPWLGAELSIAGQEHVPDGSGRATVYAVAADITAVAADVDAATAAAAILSESVELEYAGLIYGWRVHYWRQHSTFYGALYYVGASVFLCSIFFSILVGFRVAMF